MLRSRFSARAMPPEELLSTNRHGGDLPERVGSPLVERNGDLDQLECFDVHRFEYLRDDLGQRCASFPLLCEEAGCPQADFCGRLQARGRSAPYDQPHRTAGIEEPQSDLTWLSSQTQHLAQLPLARVTASDSKFSPFGGFCHSRAGNEGPISGDLTFRTALSNIKCGLRSRP